MRIVHYTRVGKRVAAAQKAAQRRSDPGAPFAPVMGCGVASPGEWTREWWAVTCVECLVKLGASRESVEAHIVNRALGGDRDAVLVQVEGRRLRDRR